MRVLGTAVSAATRLLADEQGWLWLYEVQVPTNPLTRFRLVASSKSVDYGVDTIGNPLTYMPAPIQHSPIDETSDGSTPRLQLQVGNAQRVMMQDLEDYAGLADQPIVIRIVHRSMLAVPTAHIRIDGIITSATATAELVTFAVGIHNLMEYKLPARRYSKFHCGHGYGDAMCAAPIDNATFLAMYPTCPKSLEACRLRGLEEAVLALPVRHPLRFGGFPGIPRVSTV